MKIPHALAQIISIGLASAFCPQSFSSKSLTSIRSSSSIHSPKPLYSPVPGRAFISNESTNTHTQLFAYNRRAQDSNYLLDEFRTVDGEIINPYKVLKVGRHADRDEIRKRYIKLSKKYHPDGVRYSKVLPGNCKDLDDVEDEWERVKLSYEILSDRKRRIKYDRNSAFDDPAAAFGRISLDIFGWGMTSFAKGILHVADATKSTKINSEKANQDNTHSGGRQNGYWNIRPPSTSDRNDQYVSENNVIIRKNTVAILPPASDFYPRSLVVESLTHDTIGDVKQSTLIVISEGLTTFGENMLKWGDLMAKGIFHLGNLATKNNSKKANQDNVYSGGKQNGHWHLRPLSTSDRNVHYIPENNVAIQMDTVAILPPASNFYSRSLVEEFLRNDAIGGVKQNTLIVVSGGLTTFGINMLEWGESITNYASMKM